MRVVIAALVIIPIIIFFSSIVSVVIGDLNDRDY